MVRAVFLDADTLGHDVDFSPLEAAAQLTTYPATAPGEVNQRIAGAEAVITNKVLLDDENFAAAPDLRVVIVTATGVNNINLEAAEQRGIRVVNAIRYARPVLVQHAFSLILALSNHLMDYVTDVRNGRWQQSNMFCRMDYPIMELAGKTLVVLGYGDLGQGVARLGAAFDMDVCIADRPGQVSGDVDGFPRRPLVELLPQADVLSVHCLLSDDTRDLIDARELAAMKSTAILVNTSRGGIVNEQALAAALRSGEIGGAGVDVLTEEPPVSGNPLLAEDIPNLLVTPHCAWASQEARQRMVSQSADNLKAFAGGTLQRWVV